MDCKFKRVVAFGDSFTYGAELIQCDMPDEVKYNKLNELTKGKLKILPNGKADTSTFKQDTYKNWIKFESDFAGPNYEAIYNSYAYPGLVAKELGLEYFNYSYPGYGIDAIYAELMLQFNNGSIDKDSLVFLGLTYPGRIVKFNTINKYGSDHISKPPVRNPFVSNTYQGPRNRDTGAMGLARDEVEREKFMLLRFKYGGDYMSEIIKVYAYMIAMKQLIESTDAKCIIVDPSCIYKTRNKECNDPLHGAFVDPYYDAPVRNGIYEIDENINVNPRREELIDILQKDFNELTFNMSLLDCSDIIAEGNKPWSCLLGHPNKDTHELLVKDYLLPFINNII